MSAQTTSRNMQNHLSENKASHLSNLYPEELLEPNKGINIREFWSVLTRNKKLLAGITITALLLSLLISLLLPPVYRASTSIQIKRQSTTASDIILDSTNFTRQPDYRQTQIQLIQSKTLALAVMDQLDIKDKFVSKPNNGFLSSLRSQPPAPEINFLKGLTVQAINTSQLIIIHYESSDPELSKKIVDSIAETFIRSNLDRQYENTEHSQKYLQSQLDKAKSKLLISGEAVNKFARENKIISLDDNQTTSTHMLKKLADELVIAERQRIKLQNEAIQLDIAAKSPDPSMVLDTPHMRALKQKLNKNQNEYLAASKRYGKKSKTALRLQRKIEIARGNIRSEANMYKQSLDSQLQAARLNETALSKHLNTLQESGLNTQSQIHTFNNLKREVISNQTIYQGLLERIKDVGIASGVESNNIIIIDKATTPYKKYKPKVKTNLIFGALIGFLLGVAAIFIREFMDDSIKDVDELEHFTGLPMLGMIPEQKGRNNAEIAQLIITEPKSQVAEAIRSLRTALSFSTENGAPQILFFTSSEATEGKTSIALNLATAYTLAGERVLLIDADLRKPSIHSLLKLTNKEGLSKYLSGHGNLASNSQQTTIDGLETMTSGPLAPDPVKLLSGKRIEELLNQATSEYDRIIIDGPPVLGLADALILANMADGTLVTIRSETTHKASVISSLKRLNQAKAHVIGTLMNLATPHGGYSYLPYGHSE